ncbi:NAD(P)H-dependent oxidoreductase [Afifella sp. H1R]|uniref:NADPH-dependent FMN reductase n=1 Tax=Afifella sp. H1R TaxID=2908841 RepID=UPI001F30E1FC|nr:NADPH-dependent FMN reductase [Afifella sp. H1R]MCF1504128.1 NAD(P)H-dependent oxidoreductase [Afifella sp. H1R]
MSATKTKLLGLPGSLRRESYSRAVLQGLAADNDGTVELQIGHVDLPLYNADLDGDDAPEAVREFRQAVAASDGLVIATPEYNHGIPGVLKNALDWASRPRGSSSLMGKPVLVVSASPAFTGGVRAQAQLNETLHAAECRLVGGPQIVIGNVGDRVRDGRLVDPAILDFARDGLKRLQAMIAA